MSTRKVWTTMFKTLSLGAVVTALFLLFQPVAASADHFMEKYLDAPVCNTEIYEDATKDVLNIAKFEGQVAAESVRAIIEQTYGPGGFPFEWSRVDFFMAPGAERSLMIVFAQSDNGQECAMYMNDMLSIEEVSDIVVQMQNGGV